MFLNFSFSIANSLINRLIVSIHSSIDLGIMILITMIAIIIMGPTDGLKSLELLRLETYEDTDGTRRIVSLIWGPKYLPILFWGS